MRWQLGGNLQPVRMVCQFDWRECPSAVVNYLWSEIVADVVDCLTNEALMWRVIAMLFVCTILVHCMYSKAKWIDETSINRENLEVVGSKVQDLELKVNILTYKMQYGNWPLPREFRSSGIEAGLGNFRFTLTGDPKERNSWIKHMLLRPPETVSFLPHAKIGPRSLRCLTKLINLDAKYTSTRLRSKTSQPPDGIKCSGNASEKSIQYRENLEKKEEPKVRKVEKPQEGENLAIELKDSGKSSWRAANARFVEHREESQQPCTPKVLNTSRNLSRSVSEKNPPEKPVRSGPERRARSSSRIQGHSKGESGRSPTDRVISTRETLQRVSRKLENLHSVLRIYANGESEAEVSSKREVAESILRDLKNLGGLPTESESEGRTSGDMVPKLLYSNTEESTGAKGEPDSVSDFEQCQTDADSSSEPSSTGNPAEFRSKFELAKNCHVLRKDSFVVARHEDLSENICKNVNTSSDSGPEDLGLSRASGCTGDGQELGTVQIFNEEEPKNEENENKNNIRTKVKNYFESKLLDIICEEQSAGSSTEKNSKSPKVQNISPSRIEESFGEVEIEEDLRDSRLNAMSKSSEYFSLSNLEDSRLGQASTISTKMAETLENRNSSSEGDQLSKTNHEEKEQEESLHKNINELLDQSVKNIRDYIQQFSKMQSDAILDTKNAIIDTTPPSYLKNCSSEDNIMHFVNTVAMVDSMCEDLPKELPELAMVESLVDLSDSKTDYSLERRPGIVSLTKKQVEEDEEFSNEAQDSRSGFESALSEPEVDYSMLFEERSCEELVMDYSFGSESELSEERLPDTSMNLIEFEEASQLHRGTEEEHRTNTTDSPLTGRTVIRASGGSMVNLESESASLSHLEDPEGLGEIIYSTGSSQKLLEEEITKKDHPDVVKRELIDEDCSEIKNTVEDKNVVTESRDSAISESTDFSVENATQMRKNCEGVENSTDVPDLEKSRVGNFNSAISSKANLSVDTSGSYMDASSREHSLNSKSTTGLALEKQIVNSRLQAHRAPWNTAFGRASSLNNATILPVSLEKTKSKPENRNQVRNNSLGAKPTRSQSFGTRGKSSSYSNRRTNISETSDQAVSRSKSVDLRERRSRSYATPRKSTAPGENSTSSQQSLNSRKVRARTLETDRNNVNKVEKSKSVDKKAGEKSDKLNTPKKLEELAKVSTFDNCASKTASRSCIPVLKTRIRSKSPVRGPLTMSTSSWREEALGKSNSVVENTAEGKIARPEKSSIEIGSCETAELLEKDEKGSTDLLPKSRTVIYVNIVTEQENSAIRVVDPKKFLEYLKDRELKIDRVVGGQEQEAGGSPRTSSALLGSCSSPRLLTVVSSAVGEKIDRVSGQETEDGRSLEKEASQLASWALRVEQREIQVSAKPSVMDTSTSISDLPEGSPGTPTDLHKFEIFQVPQEFTKDEYIMLLDALNRDPDLYRLKEMQRLCEKIGVGFEY